MKNHLTAAHRLDEGGSIIQVATEPVGAEITNCADRVLIATQGANLPAARNRRSNYLSANETGCAKDEAGGHGVGTVNATLHTAAGQALQTADRAGERAAIVGPSGIGKSTLASLVLRLYDPTQGAIFIDGHDIREFTLESLRSQISIVLQDNVLFAASVRDNIACGRPEATKKAQRSMNSA